MSIRTAATTVALSVTLLGCAAEEGRPTVLPPAPSSSAMSPMAPPSHTASASSVQVPPEATAESQQGAAAFARFFFDQVNRGYVEQDAGIVRRLALEGCGSCAAVASDIERLQGAQHEVSGLRYKITSAEASPADGKGRITVDFRFDADRYIERDAAGQIVQDFPAQAAQDGQLMLARVDAGWRALAIRLLDN